MNNIYKTKYNESLGAWVAVPEIAKGRGKSSSGGRKLVEATSTTSLPKLMLSGLTIALMNVLSMQAFAAPTECQVVSGNAFQCGPDATAITSESVAVGLRATAQGSQSTALGNDSLAYGYASMSNGGNRSGGTDAPYYNKFGDTAPAYDPEYSAPTKDINGDGTKTAVGVYAQYGSEAFRRNAAIGHNSQSWGTHAQSLGNNSIAMGLTATAGDASFELYGSQPLERIKGVEKFNSRSGDNTIAIGTLAYALSDDSLAFGRDSFAVIDSSAAVGAKSEARRGLFNSTVTSSDEKITTEKAHENANRVYAVGNADDVLKTLKKDDNGNYLGEFSVGNEKQTRQITNLAAGSLDTDAVNVAQLRSVANSTVKYYSVNDGTEGSLGSDTDHNKSNKGAIGANALAAGVGAKAYGTDTITIGRGTGIFKETRTSAEANVANYDLTGNVSLGAESGVVLKAGQLPKDPNDTAVKKQYNTTLGYGTKSYGSNNVAIGNGSVAGIGLGVNAYGSDKTTPYPTHDNAVAIGNGAIARQQSSIAIGDEAEVHNNGANAIAIGRAAFARDHEAVAIGDSAQAIGIASTAVGYKTEASMRATAVGFSSQANSFDSVAIGSGNSAWGKGSVSLGHTNKIGDASVYETVGRKKVLKIDNNAHYAVGIGESNRVYAGKSVAVGYKNNIQKNAIDSFVFGNENIVSGTESIAVGKGHRVSGEHSGAFGDPTIISGSNSYAFGNNNKIAQDNTFVLGNSVTTSQKNSVILGNESTDREATPENDATVNGITYSGFVGLGSSENGVVSVGNAGGERQIINVAAGKISDDSTDAINGSQLYHVAYKLTDEIKAAKTEVIAGNNVTIDEEDDSNDGHKKYTVNAKKSTVSAGSTDVDVTPGAETNDTTDYVVDLSQTTKDKIAKGAAAKDTVDNKGLTFNADGGTSTGIKKLGSEVAVTGDSNITTKATTDGVQVTLNKALTGLTSVAVTNGPTINASGISMGNTKITGLVDGTANSDAVNLGQLNSKLNAQKTHYFHVNSSGGINYNNNGATGVNAMAIGRARANGESGIALGNGAVAYDPNALAIGKGAYVENYLGESSDGIAIGSNARSVQGGRRGFVQTLLGRYIPGSTKGIAIGKDTYANESTVDIGAKSVNNQTKGANRRGVTSVGADAFAAAHFSTITGSYSTIVSDAKKTISGGLQTQGFASTINGSLNSIIADGDSGDGVLYDGVANAITGTANVIEHSNGALIMGAGNKISNSRKELVLNDIPTFGNITDPNKLNEILNKRDTNGKKPELGSVGIFGGGNEVDYAYYSNVQGIDNALKGGANSASQYVSIDGYRNQLKNVQHLMNFGSFNKVTNGEENIIMGNYNELAGDAEDRSDAKRNVVLGFQDKDANLIGKNISNNQIIGSNVTVAEGTTKGVLLGDNAKITKDKDDKALTGAIALGAESVVNRAALSVTDISAVVSNASSAINQVYALGTATDGDKQAIVDTVKGELAAVSVGDTSSSDKTQWKTRQITGLAAGSDDTDAVNVAQLKAVANKLEDVNTTVNKGWKLNTGSTGTGKVEGNASTKVGPDAEVKYIAGDNIKLIQNGTEITIQADNVVAYDSDAKDKITLGGAGASPVTITNVKNGEVSATSTDAINGSQLHAQGVGVQNIIGGSTTYNPLTGEYENTDIGGTGESNINDAIAAVKTSAAAAKTEVKGEGNITVTPDTTTASDGHTIYTVKIKDDVTFNSANIGGVQISSGTSSSGGKITNLEDGDISSSSTDAVNGSQLHETNERVTTNAGNIANNTTTLNKGMDFAGNKGEFNRKLGDKVTIKGSLADGEKASSSNIRTEADDQGNIEILLADAPEFKGKVTAKGFDAGGEKITNVARGNVAAGSTDAVNGSQLYETNQRLNASISKVNEGLNFSGDTGSTHNAQLGSTVQIKGADKNIQTQVSGSTIKIKLANNLEVDSVKAGDTVVNNEGVSIHNGPSLTKNGINAGNQRITGVANGLIAPNSRDAVNGGQIYDLANGINNHINQVDDRARGGIASAMASAGLPQAYLPGKSMISASAGTYRGETAIAIGVSSISDNGKWILKGTANANRNDLGVSVGVGYQW
ncbi:YadA-like family protein [Cardiobacteriaceae bacterium TAE3-ERU3]|nr:YadA-like family protein [Cardiobacteriaceae bacterium TAE3-ERU3]